MTSSGHILLLLAMYVLAIGGCDAPQAGLKKQRNTEFEFYGVVVDQDGKPLAGARVEYEVEQFPKDWTFNNRGRPNILTSIVGVSDAGGRFELKGIGCFMRTKSVHLPGYRHLYETSPTNQSPSNHAYELIAWGDLCYKSDYDHPAIYVLVRDGVKQVSALPSAGGFDSDDAGGWRENVPAWPRSPSLKDIVRR